VSDNVTNSGGGHRPFRVILTCTTTVDLQKVNCTQGYETIAFVLSGWCCWSMWTHGSIHSPSSRSPLFFFVSLNSEQIPWKWLRHDSVDYKLGGLHKYEGLANAHYGLARVLV
jgi:hypothetical protein